MTTLRVALALVDSAVLAPVYRDADDRLRLVFIRRSPFGIAGCGQMMGQEFGLALDNVGEMLLQRRRDPSV